MDDFYKILAIGGEEVVETPSVKEKEKAFVSRLKVPRMRRSKSRDKARDVAKEMAEAVRGDDEEGAFRRSSLTMRSPTNGARIVGQETAAPPDVLRNGDLELIPITQVERLDAVAANGVRDRRAFTPLEIVGKGEDPIMVMEESTLIEKREEISEASSTVFAPARTAKRARGLSSDSVTEDEAFGAGAEARHRRKRGRPRTTNIVDVIRAREKKKEEEKRKERQKWEERRMANPNLEILRLETSQVSRM